MIQVEEKNEILMTSKTLKREKSYPQMPLGKLSSNRQSLLLSELQAALEMRWLGSIFLGWAGGRWVDG